MAVEIATAYVQIVPSIRGLKEQLGKALGDPGNTRSATGLGERLAKAIGSSFTKSLDVAKRMHAAIKSVSESLQATGQLTADAIKATVAELAPLARAVRSLTGLITGPLARAWSAVGAASGRALQPVTNALGRATQAVAGFADTIKGRVTDAVSRATAPLVSMGQKAGSAISQAAGQVAARLAPVTNAVSGIASRVGGAMSGAVSAVGGAVGRIAAAWAPVGNVIWGGVQSGLGKIGAGITSALSSGATAAVNMAGRIGSSIGSALSGAVQVGVTAAGVAIAGLAATIATNLGAAVQRADLLHSFPLVMANIGYSSEEAAGQIDRISTALDGLPTSTDALVSVAKGLAPLTGDLTSATDVALALNNALLAGGASTTLAESAMEQYRQMLSTGTVDMAAWRSMVSAMPGQMDMLAKSLLGAEANSTSLYQAMRDGNVTFDQFNGALLDLNANGADGLASFAEQARTATQGIGTSLENVRNRVTKAIASIIEAIGVDVISTKINEMSSGIVGMGERIAGVITSLKAGGGEGIAAALGPLAGLAPVIGGVVGALGGLATRLPMIGGLFSGLSGPVGIVIGLLVSMWTQSEALQTAVGSVFSTLGTTFQALAPVVSALTTAFAGIAGTLGDSLAQAITAILPGLTSIAQTIFPVLTQVITDLTPVLTGVVGTIGQALVTALTAVMPALTTMAQAIFPVLGQVIAALAPVFAQLVGIIAGVFAQVIQILAPILAQIATALMPVLLQVVQALIPPIMQVIATIMPVVQQILPILGQLLTTLVTVLLRIISAVLPPLATVLGTVISVFASLVSVLTVAVMPVFRLLGSVAQVVFNVIGAIIMWLWNTVFSPVFTRINEKLTTFKTFLDETVKPAITNAVSAMGDAFNSFKDTVSSAMDKIKSAAAKPINFVINTVYKSGIKKAFDTIAEKIGLSTRMPDVSPIAGYASGGVLPGYTPGRDIYHFVSHDGGGRLALSGGEAIMRPEWVRAVGGPRMVHAMNAAARYGRSLPLGDRGYQHFADGGLWDKVKDAVSGGVESVASWVSSAAEAASQIISDPLGAVTNLIRKPVNALMGSLPGGGFPKDIAGYVPNKIIDGISSFLKSKTETMSASDLVSQARLAIGTPYVWGGVNVPGGVDCSGLIVWALRQMGKNVIRHTAATFQANSTPVSSPVPGDLIFWGNPAYHVAVASGNGRMVEAPTFGMSVRETPIYGAVTYGRFKYDEGGFLQPGLTMVENQTGKPEPVLTSDQWDRMGQIVNLLENRDRVLEVRDVDGALIGRMRVEAERALTGVTNDIRGRRF